MVGVVMGIMGRIRGDNGKDRMQCKD